MTLSGYIALKLHTSITDLRLIAKEGARNALWKLLYPRAYPYPFLQTFKKYVLVETLYCFSLIIGSITKFTVSIVFSKSLPNF